MYAVSSTYKTQDVCNNVVIYVMKENHTYIYYCVVPSYASFDILTSLYLEECCGHGLHQRWINLKLKNLFDNIIFIELVEI